VQILELGIRGTSAQNLGNVVKLVCVAASSAAERRRRLRDHRGRLRWRLHEGLELSVN
jgi:hypothetical protein